MLYINDLPQAAVSDSLLYADNTCIVYKHKNVTEIKKQLLRYFSSLCHWFVDNLFGTKHNFWTAKALNIMYNGTEIKQYLGCILDQSLFGESMFLKVIDKVN